MPCSHHRTPVSHNHQCGLVSLVLSDTAEENRQKSPCVQNRQQLKTVENVWTKTSKCSKILKIMFGNKWQKTARIYHMWPTICWDKWSITLSYTLRLVSQIRSCINFKRICTRLSSPAKRSRYTGNNHTDMKQVISVIHLWWWLPFSFSKTNVEDVHAVLLLSLICCIAARCRHHNSELTLLFLLTKRCCFVSDVSSHCSSPSSAILTRNCQLSFGSRWPNGW